MAEIERDTALVSIDVEEQAALAAFGHRSEFAVVATVKPLDADHIGAEVRQQHRAVRSRDEAAKIDDSNSFKRSRHNAQHRTF